MAEYYAVERSPIYIAHYGVKGMRKGVRKAIERSKYSKLDKYYRKAQKKMDRLNRNADIGRQSRKAKISAAKGVAKYAKTAVLGASTLGIGGAVYQTGKFALSKYRASGKGHARAVAKRDAWESEMNKAFAGTGYRATNRHGKKRRW